MDVPETDSNIKQTEDRIINMLGPIEPLVMRIQSLLVWEFPRRSALMFICAHLIFWCVLTSGDFKCIIDRIYLGIVITLTVT